MKKMLLVVASFGIAGLAQAVSVSTFTILTGSSIDGANAYWYKVTATDLGLTSGQSISDVNLNFNNITLTTSGQETLHADLINGSYRSGSAGDNDNPSDFFSGLTGYPYYLSVDHIGDKTDLDPNVSTSWSWGLTGSTLTDLNNDLANLGAFDIGIDPDCHYTVGSITLTYQTAVQSAPDTAMTAELLGMSLLGLVIFRRKLAFN